MKARETKGDDLNPNRRQAGADAGVHGIVPTPAVDRPLTREQEAFRRLLSRVEFLRESIDNEEEGLDAALAFYAAEIVPRLGRKTALQKNLVRALAPYLNQTFFRRRQERFEMREVVQEALDEIAQTEKGLNDADLREISSAVYGVPYAERERKTLASVREALAQMFAEAGVEADFSALDCASTEAEFMARAEELTARMRKLKEAEMEEHCHETGHHVTEDEQLREAEAFRKKSVANIYKQLARVLHPDLERDSERQKQKVELMQELTVAFRQNDLHTLLRLEMQWIENEGGNLERLTDEKLGVYNEVLRGQVEGLERRQRDLLFHPRYRPIMVSNLGLPRPINGPERARELDDYIGAIERAVALMESAQTVDDVRAAVSLFRPAAPFSDL
ncbi:MAG TPA: hypothetical protein VFY29_18955 [Terriglobia bacterium]|nr:hypothetical protein [Terriglobia bacterium]